MVAQCKGGAVPDETPRALPYVKTISEACGQMTFPGFEKPPLGAARRCDVLAAKTVEAQGISVDVLAAKAVEARGVGGVLAAEVVEAKWVGGVLAAKAVEAKGEGTVLRTRHVQEK